MAQATPRSTLLVRPVRPREWELLRDVRLAALTESPDAFGSTLDREASMEPKAWQRWITGIGSDEPQTLCTYVAIDKSGRFRGIATGSMPHASPDRAHLFGMWVAPERRRAGLGKQLVAAVVAWATENSAERLDLRVTASNTDAVAMYTKLGFVATGEQAPLRDGSSITTVAMSLALGDEEPRSGIHPAARRVLNRLGDRSLIDKLTALSGADLTSLLMTVMDQRADAVHAPEVLHQYQADRFSRPGAADARALRTVEDRFLGALPDPWELIVLSPLVPFGTHFATGAVSQQRIVSTIRANEVAADPTHGLALEAAVRRRMDRAQVVRLAAVQRATRAQFFGEKNAWAHFGLMALATAVRKGRDPTFASLIEHIQIHCLGLRYCGADRIRILATDWSGSGESAFGNAVVAAFAAEASVTVDAYDSREAGRGYYEDYCFKIHACFGTTEFEASDGGVTNWTEHLLNDRRERLCISGTGLDRVALQVVT